MLDISYPIIAGKSLMSTEMNMSEKPLMEKHFQTIIVTILLAISGWVALTTQATSVQVATMKVQIETLSAKVENFSSDQYRSSEAVRDLMLRDQRLSRLEERIDRLEERGQ